MILLTMGATGLYIPPIGPFDPPVQILAGARGTLDDVTPDDAEIAAAQARLGDTGFIAYLACSMDNVSQATRAREMGDMAAAFNLSYQYYNAEQ